MPDFNNQFMRQQSIVDEPWGNAVLYQPYEAEQILLAENASCLATKALLNMCNLEYDVKTYSNAEFMSPGGHRTKLPFISVGAFFIAEFEHIAAFIEMKGIILSRNLDSDTKLDMRAYIALAENIFTNAELYISWMDKDVLEKTTKPRYTSVYPWPLSTIQFERKKKEVLQQLKIFEWKLKTLDEVASTVDKMCNTLVEKLGEAKYFYGDQPTELDALIFGHLFTILTTSLPNNILAEIINKNQSLVNFCKRIESNFFK